jgi:hypothetical protein
VVEVQGHWRRGMWCECSCSCNVHSWSLLCCSLVSAMFLWR